MSQRVEGPTGRLSGERLAHFELLDLLGAGGFGEVYRARDTRLGRTVAIKLLPEAFSRDAERRERFRREAIAASALNHPNICTVHDLVEAGGQFLIVMELVEGKTLHAALAGGPLPPADVLPIAIQVADALAEAHRAGILHRDVKCGNIALGPRGQAKVLDFGLAKIVGTGDPEGATLEKVTAEGTASGTLGYMSPEQLLGKPLDRRSDLFSFGVVLYEMVTAQLPFQGGPAIAVAHAILHAEPRDFGNRPVPEPLKAIIRKLLRKEPGKRYASAEELLVELRALEASTAPGRRAALSRGVRIGMAAAAVVVLAAAGWVWHRWSRERWALGTAIPEIERLAEAEEFVRAAELVREAQAVLPGNPKLKELWTDVTGELSVESDPPGADVSIRPFRGDQNGWQDLGKTPLQKVRVPQNSWVCRVSKPGFVSQYRIWVASNQAATFRLDPEGAVPAGMVRVRTPKGMAALFIPGLGPTKVPIDDYLIDQAEVTNEEYGKFVAAGGYQQSDFWKQPFVRDGRTIPWEEAIALLRDTTGRPGPATWEVGTFPKGLEKHPVAGVSWYEAAAYAEFAGKSLPTVYHWQAAAQPGASHLIAPGSNFQEKGTLPVKGPAAASGFGTYDMAGNVKEWCSNEDVSGKRFLLGGGFGEESYMFVNLDAQSPWERRANYGLRCVELPSPPSPVATARIVLPSRDFSKEKPVSDEVFEAFRSLYAYDREALNAKVEETTTTEGGTREKVTFDAAYGGERVTAYLFLPKNSRPPYQVVVFFGGDHGIRTEKFPPDMMTDSFFARSGRAVLFPVYKGTFERRDGLKSDWPEPTAFYRDHMIAWSKDVGRSLDYLETRKDIDSGRVAYNGYSWGAEVAPVLLAMESRFRAAILVAGGLGPTRSLPEADKINFLGRVRTPVLMLNGRYDFFFPVASAQLPFFRLLGTPEKERKHVIFESGHNPPSGIVRESLDWLERYLGPVLR